MPSCLLTQIWTVILVPDKTDLNQKLIRTKGNCCILLKGTDNKDVILNTYAPNTDVKTRVYNLTLKIKIDLRLTPVAARAILI